MPVCTKDKRMGARNTVKMGRFEISEIYNEGRRHTMLLSELDEEIREVLFTKIGSELHYRFGGDTRHHMEIGTLEMILTTVSGAFILPYVQTLAKKAAEETWKRLTTKTINKEEQQSIEIGRLINEASESQHDAALKEALTTLSKSLSTYNINPETKLSVETAVISLLKTKRIDSNKDGSDAI
jgi:hypothetical protein